jgi:hypothetical protein
MTSAKAKEKTKKFHPLWIDLLWGDMGKAKGYQWPWLRCCVTLLAALDCPLDLSDAFQKPPSLATSMLSFRQLFKSITSWKLHKDHFHVPIVVVVENH